ncbi:MAG: Uracil phosphoribosyltransferase [Phycisphaerae bacterium]|nr:Uracil phosphoribosyltransferase [Phycisphaerae bacterium]
MIRQFPGFPNVRLVSHPLIQQKLTTARKKTTKNREFRQLLNEIAGLMVYELTSDSPTRQVEVETPLQRTNGVELASEIILVPILRAGLGMTNGVLQLVPQARVGHIGLYRDEETLQPVTYYHKLPPNMDEAEVMVIDPMLATGGSITAAVTAIKQTGARRIKMMCLVAAPEGMKRMLDDHADVVVYTAAVDERLNERGYILPGLGDAGDRLFGTE